MNDGNNLVEDTVEPLVRLAPRLYDVMHLCRRDLNRLFSRTDYCETCPLLFQCNGQEQRTAGPHKPNNSVRVDE